MVAYEIKCTKGANAAQHIPESVLAPTLCCRLLSQVWRTQSKRGHNVIRLCCVWCYMFTMVGGYKVLLVAFIVPVAIATNDEYFISKQKRDATFIKRGEASMDCFWKKYAPNGDIKDISGVKTPKAVLDVKDGLLSFLTTVSKNTAKGTAIAMHAIKFSAKIMKAAPYLGPALGVFTTIVGAATPKNSIHEVMDKVNEAIGKLSAEVNKKLDHMKGYVDSKVAKLEKELIEREYKEDFKYWVNCLRRVTEPDVNKCQRDALELVLAKRGKFAIHSNKRGQITRPQKDFQVVRQLEAYLVAFRDWVNLVVLQLTPLAEAYCYGNRKNEANAKDRCELYASDLKRQAEFAIKYSKNAIEYISSGHRGDGTGRCSETVDCQSNEKVEKKMKSGECWCVIESSNTKTLCTLKYKRSPTEKDSSYKYVWYGGGSFDLYNKKKWGKDELGIYAEAYQKQNGAMIREYWQKNVGIFYTQWEKAVEIADGMIKLLGIKQEPKPIPECGVDWVIGYGNYDSSISTTTPDPVYCIYYCAKKARWGSKHKSINAVTMPSDGSAGCWCGKKIKGVDYKKKAFKTCSLKGDRKSLDKYIAAFKRDQALVSPRFEARWDAVMEENPTHMNDEKEAEETLWFGQAGMKEM